METIELLLSEIKIDISEYEDQIINMGIKINKISDKLTIKKLTKDFAGYEKLMNTMDNIELFKLTSLAINIEEQALSDVGSTKIDIQSRSKTTLNKKISTITAEIKSMLPLIIEDISNSMRKTSVSKLQADFRKHVGAIDVYIYIMKDRLNIDADQTYKLLTDDIIHVLSMANTASTSKSAQNPPISLFGLVPTGPAKQVDITKLPKAEIIILYHTTIRNVIHDTWRYTEYKSLKQFPKTTEAGVNVDNVERSKTIIISDEFKRPDFTSIKIQRSTSQNVIVLDTINKGKTYRFLSNHITREIPVMKKSNIQQFYNYITNKAIIDPVDSYHTAQEQSILSNMKIPNPDYSIDTIDELANEVSMKIDAPKLRGSIMSKIRTWLSSNKSKIITDIFIDNTPINIAISEILADFKEYDITDAPYTEIAVRFLQDTQSFKSKFIRELFGAYSASNKLTSLTQNRIIAESVYETALNSVLNSEFDIYHNIMLKAKLWELGHPPVIFN